MNFGTFENPLLLILTPPPFIAIKQFWSLEQSGNFGEILELLQRCIDCVSEDVNAGSALKLSYLSCHMFCCFLDDINNS